MDNHRLVAPAEWGLAVLDAWPDQIALLDAQGMVLAVNASWRRFALENGIHADRPVPGPGLDYPALCDAASGASAQGAAEAAAGIRAVLARSLPAFSREYPCHSPEQQRWFRMTVSPLDVAGAAAMVVHTEITERKLEELRRRDSELRLQLALDATGDGIWDWNPQTGQVYLSLGYYAMTGYTAEEEPGSLDFFRRLVHPDDWAQVMATIESHMRGETPVSEVEYRMLTASGEMRWISGRGRVVERDAAGVPLRILGLITDISSLKRIESALQESEVRYRSVVEDQTEVIGRIAVDGTILFANEVYFRFFGKTAEEIIGRKWQPVVHPDDLPMIEARLAELAPARPVVVIENRVLAGDGCWHWMQFINRGRFDGAGHLLEIQAVGRNVTKRHELEERQRELLDENMRLARELMRLQEKERAALAKELHDELSQQLVAIRAYAGAIARRTAGTRDQAHLDALAIGKSASEIYAISHRLMEGLHPQALDSAGLTAAIGGLVDRWSHARPEVRMRLHAAAIGPVDAESRIRLFRIVQECLANAIQHGHAQRIRIFVGERGNGARRRLRIVVRDDGAGMSLDAPRTGYGLIIMRERAHSLGGSLDLNSEPGRGLRVAVDVPLPA
jgi:PAS domain S-box-containing protein